VGASVVDHEHFDAVDTRDFFRQIGQSDGQRLRFVEARDLDDELHGKAPAGRIVPAGRRPRQGSAFPLGGVSVPRGCYASWTRLMRDLVELASRFRDLAPKADFASLRVVDEVSERVSVRQGVPEPPETMLDRGAMITVLDGDGAGYAATSDLSDAGLAAAVARAREWAALSRGRSVLPGRVAMPALESARYASPQAKPLRLSKAERIELLMAEARECRLDDRIVDWA